MKPHLTIITASFPLDNQETYLADEILALKKDFRITIFPLHSKQNSKLRTNLKLIRENCCRSSFTSTSTSMLRSPSKIIESSIYILKNSRGRQLIRNFYYIPRLIEIFSYLRKNQTSHIHAYWASSPAFLALMLAKWLDVEYSLTMHRYDVGENDFLYKKISNAKFVRAVSAWTKNLALERDPRIEEFESKVKIIRLSLDIPPFRKPSKIDELRIVVPADYIKRKGHTYLIKAFELLKSKLDFQIDFFGQGREKRKIIDQINRLGLGKKIRVFDRINHDALLKKYSKGNYNLLILPSLKEGLPMSVAEAFAYSVCAIASDAGGTTEIFKDKSWIVKPGSYKQLARKIIEFKELDNIEKMVLSNYKQVSKEFNSKRCANQLTALIKKQ